MTTVPTQSSRIFVRFVGASADSWPSEDDIRTVFAVHGHIVGMSYYILLSHLQKICAQNCIAKLYVGQ